MEYPWYDIIDSSAELEQGDILSSWPFPVPMELPEGQTKLDAEIIEYDTIVMSQSCDIAFRKINLALLCPIITLGEMDKYKTCIPHFVLMIFEFPRLISETFLNK